MTSTSKWKCPSCVSAMSAADRRSHLVAILPDVGIACECGYVLTSVENERGIEPCSLMRPSHDWTIHSWVESGPCTKVCENCGLTARKDRTDRAHTCSESDRIVIGTLGETVHSCARMSPENPYGQIEVSIDVACLLRECSIGYLCSHGHLDPCALGTIETVPRVDWEGRIYTRMDVPGDISRENSVWSCWVLPDPFPAPVQIFSVLMRGDHNPRYLYNCSGREWRDRDDQPVYALGTVGPLMILPFDVSVA